LYTFATSHLPVCPAACSHGSYVSAMRSALPLQGDYTKGLDEFQKRDMSFSLTDI